MLVVAAAHEALLALVRQRAGGKEVLSRLRKQELGAHERHVGVGAVPHLGDDGAQALRAAGARPLADCGLGWAEHLVIVALGHDRHVGRLDGRLREERLHDLQDARALRLEGAPERRSSF